MRRNLFLFLLIVALSSVFRISNLDLIEFKIDEASNLLLAARPLFGHPLPYGGILTSVGTLNFPLFNYLLLPLTFVSLDPKVFAFFIAIVNSLAIGCLFLIIKKYYNTTLALLTSLILAFSPWSILFSRKIWPPDLIFPIATLLFLSIHKIIIDKKISFWLLFFLSSLLLIQLEISSVFFITLLFLFLLREKPPLSFKYILVGLLLGALPAIPYLIYETTSNFPDFVAFFSIGKILTIKNPDVFIKPLQVLNQGGFGFILGQDTLTFYNKFPLIYKAKALFYLEYLLIPLGVFLFWKRYKTLRFIVYAVLTVPLAYFIFNLKSVMHYFVILIPFLAIFLSIAFYFLITLRNKILRYSFISVLSALIMYSIIFNASFFAIIRQQGGLNGDYGASLNKILPYIESKFTKYKNDPYYQEIILTSHIPFFLINGKSSFARMLYPYEETKKNLKANEKELELYPDDPRIIQELTVYYTIKRPSQKTLEALRNKALPNSAHEKIYHEVYDVFLRKR